MLREVDLIKYYPPHLEKLKDFIKISQCQNPEFNLLWLNIEKIINNIYFLTADLQGIKKFEKRLNITPIPGDTLDIRREMVYIAWNEIPPYTIRVLKALLDEICGASNYVIDVDYNNRIFYLDIDVSIRDVTRIVNELIKEILPANMVINHNVLAQTDLDQTENEYINLQTAISKHFFCDREDIKEEFEFSENEFINIETANIETIDCDDKDIITVINGVENANITINGVANASLIINGGGL